MAAPTFVAEYETNETNWTNSNAGVAKTVDVTVSAGDVLTVVGVIEDASFTLATPTGGGLTYTLAQSISITDYCAVYVWTATSAGAQTFTLSVTLTGSGSHLWGLNVLQHSGSDGVGASSKTNTTGAPSLGLTTTQADSAIVVGVGDWNAVDGTTRTWRTVNGAAATEQTYFRDSSHYTVYVGRHPDAGAAGSKTTGLSAPTGQKYSIVAVEILGTAGGGATPPPRPALIRPSLAAIQRASW